MSGFFNKFIPQGFKSYFQNSSDSVIEDSWKKLLFSGIEKRSKRSYSELKNIDDEDEENSFAIQSVMNSKDENQN